MPFIAGCIHKDFRWTTQGGRWSAANRGDKIRMGPQGRQSLTTQTRTANVDLLHRFMDAE